MNSSIISTIFMLIVMGLSFLFLIILPNRKAGRTAMTRRSANPDEEILIVSVRSGIDFFFTAICLIFGCCGGLLVYYCVITEFDEPDILIFTILCVLIFIAALLIKGVFSKTEIVVTNKRVYGVMSFGLRADLPIDAITSVGSSGLGGITVASSSGLLAFHFIKNRQEIHRVITNLLIQRQNQRIVPVMAPAPPVVPVSNADEIKKYKELLDSGIITQEEFDAKKKQLLGL